MASVANYNGTKIHHVPDRIYQVLSEELEISDSDIAALSPKERFDKFCNWEGLIHWGDELWELVLESQEDKS